MPELRVVQWQAASGGWCWIDTLQIAGTSVVAAVRDSSDDPGRLPRGYLPTEPAMLDREQQGGYLLMVTGDVAPSDAATMARWLRRCFPDTWEPPVVELTSGPRGLERLAQLLSDPTAPGTAVVGIRGVAW